MISLDVEVPDDYTDNEITTEIETAIGKITRFHNPEVMDIQRSEETT